MASMERFTQRARHVLTLAHQEAERARQVESQANAPAGQAAEDGVDQARSHRGLDQADQDDRRRGGSRRRRPRTSSPGR